MAWHGIWHKRKPRAITSSLMPIHPSWVVKCTLCTVPSNRGVRKDHSNVSPVLAIRSRRGGAGMAESINHELGVAGRGGAARL